MVFEIKENGEYPVVGIDKVIANVLPKSTDIVITENGEYNPNDYDVDAFSKVDVDVKPKLEDLTATDNGTNIRCYIEGKTHRRRYRNSDK